jgi:hypothetical protein
METWLNVYKDDNQTISNLFANPVTKATATLNEFLRRILYNQVLYVKFQCASYYERVDELSLLAQSRNLTLLRGKLTSFVMSKYINYKQFSFSGSDYELIRNSSSKKRQQIIKFLQLFLPIWMLVTNFNYFT